MRRKDIKGTHGPEKETQKKGMNTNAWSGYRLGCQPLGLIWLGWLKRLLVGGRLLSVMRKWRLRTTLQIVA